VSALLVIRQVYICLIPLSSFSIVLEFGQEKKKDFLCNSPTFGALVGITEKYNKWLEQVKQSKLVKRS
jgi:hypothetical protein